MTGRSIDELVDQLTLDELATLTAGEDLFSTFAVDRVGIPKVRLTDGPNGARGAFIPGADAITAACVPCGSALGATWDPLLIERIGGMLGEEARSKACRVLLAPTVNLHRSPLAGRNFECYSEDPFLSGKTAAAFIRGVQSRDVACTVKHFAGNDAEFERHTINSVIDERTLRELYLVPFELAVREGGVLGVMTAYNRLNGPYCTENPELLATLLRGEWGFTGFVLTDWYGVGTTIGSAAAGLDLEMPGPARFYGAGLAEAVRAGDVDQSLVADQVRRLLTVFDGVGALDDPIDEAVQAIDRPDHRELARETAAAATVLLTNDGILPLDIGELRSVALIGPNVDATQIMGGGSASFEPHYRVSVLDAMRTRLGGEIELRYARGCDVDRSVPPLRAPMLLTPAGEGGLALEFFANREWSGEPVHTRRVPSTRLLLFGQPDPTVPADGYSVRATGRFTPTESGTYTFTLVQAGRARLLVGGTVVLDGFTDPPPRGKEFFGAGSDPIETTVELEGGRTVDLVVEYSDETARGLGGFQIGAKVVSPPDLLDRAVAAATGADVAIVVVGTNEGGETEGRDRRSMDLPGDQDDLVAHVTAANPNTVVVLNTGAPVSLPWCDRPRALLQGWLGGQEMGNAIVDVLTGVAEPGGRLPTTLPIRLEDNPSFGNFPGEFGEVRYGEGVLMGYRWYDARRVPVRFPFGHGLSYTTFTIGAPELSSAELAPDDVVSVRVRVTNTGARPGSEVVQCYVAPPRGAVVRPPQELRSFAKVHLDPGASAVVTLELHPRAFAYWNPSTHDWQVDPGRYELRIGRSSAEVAHTATIELTG